jgi:hypothetical protein
MKTKLRLLFVAVSLFSPGCGVQERQPDLFLVPDGYVGWLRVEFQVKDAPALPLQNGYRVYRFSRSGKIRTSSAMQEGMAKDKIFYMTPKGWKELSGSDDGGKGMVWGGFTTSATTPTLNLFIGPWERWNTTTTQTPQSLK